MDLRKKLTKSSKKLSKRKVRQLKTSRKLIKHKIRLTEDLQEAVKTQSQVNEDLQEAVKTQSQVIKDLQEAVKAQNQVNKDLQEKDQPCGFSARYDSRNKIVNNEVLLFGHVDINIGDGYNATTGMFTAPRTGMYAFHLIVTTAGINKFININIFVNDLIVGKVFAKENSYYDQSSISFAVMLLEGRMVKPIVTSGALDKNPYSSVFSGYLVQAM